MDTIVVRGDEEEEDNDVDAATTNDNVDAAVDSFSRGG